jgi:hypothetical protein
VASPPSQSHNLSGPGVGWLRTGMADMGAVRDACARQSLSTDSSFRAGRAMLCCTWPTLASTVGRSDHPNHTALARRLHAYLRWRNAHARHPDVLAAQRAVCSSSVAVVTLAVARTVRPSRRKARQSVSCPVELNEADIRSAA